MWHWRSLSGLWLGLCESWQLVQAGGFDKPLELIGLCCGWRAGLKVVAKNSRTGQGNPYMSPHHPPPSAESWHSHFHISDPLFLFWRSTRCQFVPRLVAVNSRGQRLPEHKGRRDWRPRWRLNIPSPALQNCLSHFVFCCSASCERKMSKNTTDRERREERGVVLSIFRPWGCVCEGL